MAHCVLYGTNNTVLSAAVMLIVDGVRHFPKLRLVVSECLALLLELES